MVQGSWEKEAGMEKKSQGGGEGGGIKKEMKGGRGREGGERKRKQWRKAVTKISVQNIPIDVSQQHASTCTIGVYTFIK